MGWHFVKSKICVILNFLFVLWSNSSNLMYLCNTWILVLLVLVCCVSIVMHHRSVLKQFFFKDQFNALIFGSLVSFIWLNFELTWPDFSRWNIFLSTHVVGGLGITYFYIIWADTKTKPMHELFAYILIVNKFC